MSTKIPNEKILAEKRLEGVVEVGKLSPNTYIFVETNAQVFEILTRMGVEVLVTCAGKRSFPRQMVEFVGSISQDGMLFAGLIVKNHHLIFKLEGGRYTTGCVHSASIKGKDYNYNLWSE